MVFQFPDVKVVLLDIEGTVCPISFVKGILFPYALSALPPIISQEWDSPSLHPYRDAFPAEFRGDPTIFINHVHDLTNRDVKAPYLKALQGYLWTRGYENGSLSCPLFPDVAPSLRSWASSTPPITIIIYSSGSIPAQRLLFSHTNYGDLTPLLAAYHDTTTAGPKTALESYNQIWDQHSDKGEKAHWLFLSDNPQEVRAARESGMQALLVVREGNAPTTEEEKGELGAVESFEEVAIR